MLFLIIVQICHERRFSDDESLFIFFADSNKVCLSSDKREGPAEAERIFDKMILLSHSHALSHTHLLTFYCSHTHTHTLTFFLSLSFITHAGTRTQTQTYKGGEKQIETSSLPFVFLQWMGDSNPLSLPLSQKHSHSRTYPVRHIVMSNTIILTTQFSPYYQFPLFSRSISFVLILEKWYRRSKHYS